jgi:DNA-binding LacI/PurR family transcriptional regulator/DNA-binding transcriptional regulator YhcF (GntR family)
MEKNEIKTRLHMHIHRDLRNGILSGKYSAGLRLPSENALCARYNTSRFTVRSALKMLGNEGLVKNFPGRGWEVISPTNKKNIGKIRKPVAIISRPDDCGTRLCEPLRENLGQNSVELSFFLKPIYGEAEDSEKWLNKFADAELKKIGGVIIVNDVPPHPGFAERLRREGVRLLCLPLNGNYSYDTVSTDNISASEMLVDHIAAKGHKNIIFGTSKSLDAIPSFNLRRLGYIGAMEKHGLKPEILMADHNYWLSPVEDALVMSCVKKLRGSRRAPVCLIATTDLSAMSMLSIFAKHSLKVPDDISIASFDLCPERKTILSKYGISSLTSMEEQWEMMGATATDIFLMKSDNGKSPPTSTLVPAILSEGDSVSG